MSGEMKKIEDFKIGEEITSYEYVLTEGMVRNYLEAVEDSHPWYTQDSPFGGRIVPPMLNANFTARLAVPAFQRPGLHAKQEVELLRPAKPGSKIRMVVRLADRYEKRGQEFVVVESLSKDEEKREIIRVRSTIRL